MVYLLLGDGFEEVEALTACDILRRGGVEVGTLSVSGQPVMGAHGIPVLADQMVKKADREEPEMVVLPGGWGGVQSIEGCTQAMELIRWAWDHGKYVAAICAGPTALAKLGIPEGKKATCYPGLENQMGGALMQPGAMVVQDGRLITGQAPGAAMAFALKLLEVLKGSETVKQVADGLVLHWGEQKGHGYDG